MFDILRSTWFFYGGSIFYNKVRAVGRDSEGLVVMDNLDWKNAFGIKNIQSCLWSNQEREFEEIAMASMSPWSPLIQDFATTADRVVVVKKGNTNEDIGVNSTGSTESINCLLSTTYSNTDTSVEDDDDISMIFSDCRNLLNFSSSTSGESENIIPKQGKKEISHEINEARDESFSDTRPNSETWKAARKSIQTHEGNSNQIGKKNKNCHYEDHPSMNSMFGGGFRHITESQPKAKKPRLEKQQKITNINFQQGNSSTTSLDPHEHHEPDVEAIAQMKEMVYRAAAFRPVHLGLEVVEKPKRKNVRISSDPQTVAARQRREKISERIRVLQQLVPGGSKMDTASMLEEAANYLKFLRSQVKTLQTFGNKPENSPSCNTANDLPFSASPLFNQTLPMQSWFTFQNPNPTLPTI
ncbi:hypothetical protein GIB67_002485 [Kingdonia uniflora]|uniref:BHLH domain-containing protein n=1 Tax=Kingdonia uniflora TaxID=39325 RepID=A0A7J7LAX7_9MAGN|nr:hypothetical protein GIB67_002485 [Kingdonia uniflora]